MREIKFRVWDGVKIHTVYRLEFTFNGELIGRKTYKFMQYTGIKDKNGVEIYEGDMNKTNSSLYKVVFDKCCFWGVDERGKYPIYQINHYVLDDEIFEVIGNIYENPELLEQK